jgi:hypothetical protein
MELSHGQLRYRRFFFDIVGKTYDIVNDIVYDIVYNIVYTYLTYHNIDSGLAFPIPGNSDSDLDADRQMDDAELRDYQGQLLHNFGPSQASKGPISQFMADMPSTIQSFQDDVLKTIDGLPMPSASPAPPGLSLR